MRVAITGGHGFLGWHTACRLRALHGVEPVRLGREELADPARLTSIVASVDVVFHLAGVNRAESDAAVRRGNVEAAQTLARALSGVDRPVDVVYANSIQSDLDNAYGEGKRAAAALLADSATGCFADLLLPNLFGEHGRPSYNSFVATFADRVATGGNPVVQVDKQVPLLHAQRASAALIEAVGTSGQLRPEVEERGVSEVLAMLRSMHALYGERGEVPPLTTHFEVDLFNTYRSYLFPQHFPVHPTMHSDQRGDLVETVRSHGGTGQAFVSTTRPGQVRGEHYHLRKVERFFVVKGEAEIGLRRLLDDEVVTFRLTGGQPGFVDMPTLWVHNIRNVGDTELVTMFWTDQLLDLDNPDQFPERLDPEAP
ncbi:MAG: hypothetical protein QM714_10555 [Nocardioides sp.]|uniref:polysaccharide biosynthesis C-terminal domain-containing protein n=1 Tax=Nocardioides sp. TaxID=35761 RepID=UPI0039E65F46